MMDGLESTGMYYGDMELEYNLGGICWTQSWDYSNI